MAAGSLYVVATPIGNLDDMSQRAISVLQQVDMVAAEDTRHTSRLLQHYGIEARMLPLHEHNEDARSDALVNELMAGKSIALVSDAGTPLISDPGYPLVNRARAAGAKVIPIPGACAAVAALSVSGLPTQSFWFEGFLHTKTGPRKQRLLELAALDGTLIFYEAPHRILDTLADIAECFPEREVVLARELTKTFETILKDLPAALLRVVEADPNQQKGEMVVLVGPAPKKEKSVELDAVQSALLKRLLEELPPKKAASVLADVFDLNKKAVYAAAVELKGGDA